MTPTLDDGRVIAIPRAAWDRLAQLASERNDAPADTYITRYMEALDIIGGVTIPEWADRAYYYDLDANEAVCPREGCAHAGREHSPEAGCLVEQYGDFCSCPLAPVDGWDLDRWPLAREQRYHGDGSPRDKWDDDDRDPMTGLVALEASKP